MLGVEGGREGIPCCYCCLGQGAGGVFGVSLGLSRGFGGGALFELGGQTGFFLLGRGKAGGRDGTRGGRKATGGLVDCLQVGLEGEEEGDVQGGEEEGGEGSTTSRRSTSSSSAGRTGAAEGREEGSVDAVLENVLGGRPEDTPLLRLSCEASSDIVFNQRMRDNQRAGTRKGVWVGGQEGEQVPILGGRAAGFIVEGPTEDVQGTTEREATAGLAGALEGADHAQGVGGAGGRRDRRGAAAASGCCCCCCCCCCSSFSFFSSTSTCCCFGGASRRGGRRGGGRGGGRGGLLLLLLTLSFLPPFLLLLLLLLPPSLLPSLLLLLLLVLVLLQPQAWLPLFLKLSQALLMGQVVVVPPEVKFTQGMRLVAPRTVRQQLFSRGRGREERREGGRVRRHSMQDSCETILPPSLRPSPSLPPSLLTAHACSRDSTAASESAPPGCEGGGEGKHAGLLGRAPRGGGGAGRG